MGNRLLAAATLLFGMLISGNAAATPINQNQNAPEWINANWWHYCASLDMDFLNDRYYINNNTSCDGSIGTQYAAGSGNTGVQNFIAGTGATFTRGGTTNVTASSNPFYLSTSQGQAFVSRASVTNNVTSTVAPFFIGTTGSGPSQAWVSRADSAATATYFDSTGTLQTAAKGVARSSANYYSAGAWVLGGTLIEPTATNSIRNNTMVGAAAGSPGTPPTNWSTYVVGSGVTSSIVATGTENGISYIDIQCTGTATSASQLQVYPDTTTGISASIGQTWTTSFFTKLSGGSSSGVSSTGIYINEESSSGTYLSGGFTAFTLSSTALGTARNVASRTLSNLSVARVQPYIQVNISNGSTVNFTIRIGMPQMEQSAFATSVIATSSAAVARAADVYNQQPASFVDGTGTLQFAAANTARDDHNPASPYAELGNLIEPAVTNAFSNNMMVGAVAADGVERTTSGTFSGCSGSTCTGWTTNLNSGTGTVTYASNTATLTGDGTNAASIYQAVPTVIGASYNFSIVTGAGNSVTVQAGTAAGGTGLLVASAVASSSTTNFQFKATTTSSYIQINNSSASPATTTTVSLQSVGIAPTGWAVGSPAGIFANILGVFADNGVPVLRVRFHGTPVASSGNVMSISWSGTGLSSLGLSAGVTQSQYVAVQAGSTSSISFQQWGRFSDSTGATVEDNQPRFSPSATISRFVQSEAAPSTGSTPFTVGPKGVGILLYLSGQPTVDITIDMGMPQLEQNAFATSAIPTFGSGVTRTADVYSVPNGGTYFNSSGVIVNAPANVPRLDHNPVSPDSPQGVLIEESRTNLVAASSGTSGEAPGASQNTTYTQSSVIAPDNTTYFLKCQEGTTNSGQVCRWSESSLAASTTYTVSAYVKAAGRTAFTLLATDGTNTSSGSVNLSAGTNTACGTGLGGSPFIQAIGSAGVYRVALSFTTGSSISGTPYFDFRLSNGGFSGCVGQSYQGDGTDGIYIWGIQLEAGAFPSSYIPTYNSAITRAAEVFTLPTTTGGGSGWYTQGQGTLGTVGNIPYLAITGYPGFASIDDGTSQNAIHLFISDPYPDAKSAEIFSGNSSLFGTYLGNSYLCRGKSDKSCHSFSEQ